MNLIGIQALILSLTNAEMRVFKRLLVNKEREKNYIQLFEYLSGTKGIDVHYLDKKYGRNGLEAARKYLLKMLMKALREVDAEIGIENKLLQSIKDVQILNRKGFIEESLEKLAKIKSTALTNELNHIFLIVSRLEMRYLARLQFSGISESELIQRQKLIEDVLEHEVQLHRHSSLHQILSVRFLNNGLVSSVQEKAKLNDLLLQETSILNNRNYRSFESKKAHLNFQSTYFMMIGDHEESLKIYHELNSLFHANSSLWENFPEYYIALLDGTLTDLYAIGRYKEMPFFIDALSKIKSASDDICHNIEMLCLYHQLSLLNQDFVYSTGEETLKCHQHLIDKLLKKTLSNIEAQLILMFCLVCFNMKKYKECSRLLNNVMNFSGSTVAGQSYNQFKILFLITHFELKHFDYLPYQIRSFQRRLNLNGGQYRIERLVISIIKHLCAFSCFDEQVFSEFIHAINELDTIPLYHDVIQKLQLRKWLSQQFQIKPELTTF